MSRLDAHDVERILCAAFPESRYSSYLGSLGWDTVAEYFAHGGRDIVVGDATISREELTTAKDQYGETVPALILRVEDNQYIFGDKYFRKLGSANSFGSDAIWDGDFTEVKMVRTPTTTYETRYE
ncbi:hypothetical protein ACFRAQ_34725 [Nocardia sp. NPDC056611]|uniref:hypothetical protein n=1 Tax=Nocardia sp. NPDC056611 TaxID=3345877 RepID=UPI003672F929